MRYTITGRNIEVTPGLKAAVEKKIGKLEHFFTPDTEVIVALSAQKDQQKIEVTIPVKGNTIRAEESSTDMYVSIDLVEEIIERQIRRYKKKLIDKKQAAIAFSQAFIEDEEDTAYEDDIQIVKTKKFAMKPVNPEEACLVKDYDVILERCYAQNMGGGKYKSNLADNLELIKEVGYKNVMVDTDGGQTENPHWELALAEYMQYLVDHGIPEEHVYHMTHTIPEKLLGIEE